MPATNQKDMRLDKFLLLKMRSLRKVRNMSGATVLFSSFLGLAFLVNFSSGCSPASNPATSPSNELPEITQEMINERINDAGVWEVPEENGAVVPIDWSFDEEEPKEITVVEKQMEGNRATIILDIKTRSAPKARNQRYLEGQIRTKWELRTGWVLRKWEIVKTENISMKYKNLPKPPAQNPDR